MASFSFSEHETNVTLEDQASPVPEDAPFRILLLGDWSGRREQPDSSKQSRSSNRFVEIDRDNFDAVVKKINPTLELKFGDFEADPLQLKFAALDDFHPDNLFEQVPLFANLRDARKRLLDSQTFERAAAEVRWWLGMSPSENRETTPPSPKPLVENSENLLDQILSQDESESANNQSAEKDELSVFLGKLVKPYLVQTDEQEQSKLVSALDEAGGELMRMILHHPQFQALEAAWRAAFLLVGRVETDVDLKIYLLDQSQNELVADLKNARNLTDSDFYKILVEEHFEDGEPWAAVLGNFAFGSTVDDVAALMRIGKIAEAANTPFIAQARPQILGIETFARLSDPDSLDISEDTPAGKLWTMLRSTSEAGHIGLVMPRFLARMPYGAASEPTETFSFEELQNFADNDDYLWANPVFICALLMSETFRLSGWQTGGRVLQEVEGLPLFVYREDGVAKTKPCAEGEMNLNVCEKLLDYGLMPLISFRDTDRVRVARFQSIALPAAVLQGRWSS